MKRSWIAVVLLLAGCAAIFVLQRRKEKVPITPRPLLYLVADTQREAERIPFAVTRVSDKRETQVGEQIVRSYGLNATPAGNPDHRAITDYLNAVGSRVAGHVQRKAIPYHFYLQDDPNFVNAFALPGGNVVVGRGLLSLMDSEDELAAVLGHEIAHVDNRDAIERLQYQLASEKLGLGDLFRLGAPAIEIFEAGYSKEQEFQADRTGLVLAVEAGYSPVGGVNLMRRFEKLESDYSEHAHSPIGEFAQVPFSALVEYFRSHPPATERREMLQREIKANEWNTAQPLRPLAVRSIFLCDAAEKLDAKGDFKGAIAQLKNAVMLDSHYVRAYRELARTFWRSGDAAGTVQAESDMIPVAPADADWGILARALSISDPASARSRFAALRAQFPFSTPDNVKASAPKIAELGLSFIQGKKDSTSDLETIVSSLETPSGKASARREMAWWMYRAGNLSEAQQQLEAARQVYPQSPQTAVQLAWVLSDLQRQADASELLDSSGGLSGFGERDAERHAIRAVIEWRTEQRGSATADFEIAAREDPVWMSAAWVRNNYSSSAADVIAQLESAEAKRRLKVAAQGTARGN